MSPVRVINRIFPAPSASSFQVSEFSNQRGIILKLYVFWGEGGNEGQIQLALGLPALRVDYPVPSKGVSWPFARVFIAGHPIHPILSQRHSAFAHDLFRTERRVPGVQTVN